MPGTDELAVNRQTDQPTTPSDQSLIQQIQDNRDARGLSWQWGWNNEQQSPCSEGTHVLAERAGQRRINRKYVKE